MSGKWYIEVDCARWTELSPRCQPMLGGAAEDRTAIAVRKDGNSGRPHPR